MMSEAVVRTLSFLLLIAIGFFLKRKVSSEQAQGLKQVILNLALPAVIFISLQKVEFSMEMLLMPLAALAFNFILFWLSALLYPVLGVSKSSPQFRTIRMLVPSLAPGLSCFPFLLEYAGPKTLADAAFTDIGNKVFVLIVLYMVSMSFFVKLHPDRAEKSKKLKLMSFIKMMLNEPVNLAIIAALLLITFDARYTVLPLFIQQGIDMLALLMTPLILLYIGVSVKLSWKQTQMISVVMFLRSFLTFLVSAAVVFIFSIADPLMILLIIMFPQSSVSFWPILHISSVQRLEKDLSSPQNTFDSSLAVNMLAMSLPFSTVVILVVATFQDELTSLESILWMAMFMLFLALLTICLPFLRGDQTANRFWKGKETN